MIYLTKHPDRLDLPRDGRALWLHHRSVPAPAAERTITLERFMDDPWNAVRDTELLVVVGLVSKLCNPGNRVKLGQFLTEPWPGPRRVSVDDKLFITDPWRLWWHFGCVGIDFGGCATSYCLETRWNGSVIGMRPNPCTPGELERYGDGVIRAVDPFRFDPVSIHVESMPEDVHARYLEEKEAAFNEESTPNAIIKRLAAFAQLVYPFRKVPTFREMFRSEHLEVRATDLGVDRFLVNQIRIRAELINFAAERFAA